MVKAGLWGGLAEGIACLNDRREDVKEEDLP
jgi:hypothetical protein